MTNLLEQNPYVTKLHDIALNLGIAHKFSEAREGFDVASRLLSMGNPEHPGTAFQAAELERDLGFLSVRQSRSS